MTDLEEEPTPGIECIGGPWDGRRMPDLPLMGRIVVVRKGQGYVTAHASAAGAAIVPADPVVAGTYHCRRRRFARQPFAVKVLEWEPAE